MSLARQHKAHHAALRAAAATSPVEGGLATRRPAHAGLPAKPAHASPTEPMAQTGPGALAMVRLTHDLRRLKEIQSVKSKIEAKREMLPEYADYVAGLLSAAEASGQGTADEVLPTIMVWEIDTGNYPRALRLATHVIGHNLPMPARFQRTAPCLVTEQIADAAIVELADGKAFDLDVLTDLETLVDGEDMPDEVRAKLMKAIGLELARQAEDPEADSSIAGAQRARQAAAITALKRALSLHAGCGVKKRIEALERAAKKADAPPAPPETAGSEEAPPTESKTDATNASAPKARKRGGVKPPAQAG
jgi:hypothetical protein